MTTVAIEPNPAKTEPGNSEPAPPVSVHELAEIPLSRREQYNHGVDWAMIEEALRAGNAVSIACLEGDVDTVADVAADIMEEVGFNIPQHTYDASGGRLWFWNHQPPHPSLSGGDSDGPAVQASDDPDTDETLSPASPVTRDECERRYVREPIRYDDVEPGRVHTPEGDVLRSMVKSMSAMTVEELVRWTGFSEDVIDDLLEGYRPVPASVWHDVLKGARELAETEPARYEAIIRSVHNLMLRGTGLGFTRPAAGDDGEPADSEPNRDRERVDPKYIECCVAEFRTLDADRVPFREVDWTVVRNPYLAMDWETAEFAFNRGKVVAIACKRHERAIVEAIAFYHLSNDLCSYYHDGLVWFRRPGAIPED